MLNLSYLGDSTVVDEVADVHGTMTPAPATAGSVVVDIPDLIPLTLSTTRQQSAISAKIDMDKIEKTDPKSVEEVQGGNVTVAGILKSTAASSIGGKSNKPKTMTDAALVSTIIFISHRVMRLQFTPYVNNIVLALKCQVTGSQRL